MVDPPLNELKVMPIKKKQYDLVNIPGSSPEQRVGIPDLQYKYQHGKAPMIEKRDSKYRMRAQNSQQ